MLADLPSNEERAAPPALLAVRGAKSDAGVRWVPIMPALRSELLARKMAVGSPDPDAYVFATRTGRRLSRHNTNTRILQRAHELADQVLLCTTTSRRFRSASRSTRSGTPTSASAWQSATTRPRSAATPATPTWESFRIYTHVMALQDGDREQLTQCARRGR